ncbi:integrase/recombinase XerD [Clostridium grantii DSM 8605]|uniref:Integrase/recombinase XerD n=1 Tax=Clostridium grantii DSM 8605 TaxID=1121316 RepID=A0A1M5SBW5_9CLOT|nr:integrase/recombinase XerD [Clostridium grantii DSM 8605]
MGENKNCNEEVIIKILGKTDLNLTDQLKLRGVIEEVLYLYDVTTKETSLIVSDLYEKIHYYIAIKRLDGLSQRTLDNYINVLTCFSDKINKPVSSINTADIRMYLAWKSKTIKNTSLNTIRSVLKSFFNWLQREEYIQKNPMDKINTIKVSKRLREALTDEELELLRSACITDREKALVEFAYSTGCRLSEIRDVNVEDINWSEMSLRVIGKGDKERKVYFSVKAKLLLKNYLQSRKGESNALFIATKGSFARLGNRSIQKEISNVASRTKINKAIYPHLLRHTFATLKL